MTLNDAVSVEMMKMVAASLAKERELWETMDDILTDEWRVLMAEAM